MKSRVLACYNFKGGVGKTAAAVNLAYSAARRGHRVLVWDLDPQGAASFYFRVKPRVKGGARKLVNGKRELADFIKATNYENLELMPADFSYRNLDVYLHKRDKSNRRLEKLLAPVSNEYDYVILDCPPGISRVSENIFQASDALVIPLIPTYLSTRVYETLKAYFEKKRDTFTVKLLPFFSMVDRRKRLHREVVEEFRERHPEVLKCAIGYASGVEQMGRHRAPVQAYAASSVEGRSFDLLWLEVVSHLERRTTTPAGAAFHAP